MILYTPASPRFEVGILHAPVATERERIGFQEKNGRSDPDGIRTRVASVKGMCPRPLDDGATAIRSTSASYEAPSVSVKRLTIVPETHAVLRHKTVARPHS